MKPKPNITERDEQERRERLIEATRDFLSGKQGRTGGQKRSAPQHSKKEPKSLLFRENLENLRASDENH